MKALRTLALTLPLLAVSASPAFAGTKERHVPAPHVCADGSAPQRGGVGEDGHSHQKGKGHQVHGNGFGYGHGCGDTDGGGGDNGGGGQPTDQ